jgi:multimeric flavodoxin WrbA
VPRFFLNIRNGSGFTPDEEGRELADLGAARDEAVKGIRSILAEEAKEGRVDLAGAIEVTDGGGAPIAEVPFGEAVAVHQGEAAEFDPHYLTAIGLNCSLRGKAGEDSSTDKMIGLVATHLAARGVAFSETIRLADHDVKPGVTSDEGEGDAWPDIRRRILEADVLIFGTPIWMGQMSSVAKRVLERMDAFLSETDENGRMPSFGKVAVAAIVGNEDGAHSVSADVYQALNDTGWTIPAGAVSYWVGEAMGKIDFKDLDEVPEKVRLSAAMAASNAAHLARLLRDSPYAGVGAEA